MAVSDEPKTGAAAGASPLRVESERQWSEWMRAAQAGDAACYDRLLRAVVPYVRAVAARTVRVPDDVEDIVQETLMTIHSIRHTYDPARPFVPWLAAIARRRAIDRLRRRMRGPAREVEFQPEHETFLAADANSEEPYADPAALARAVAALPAGQRQAIELLKLKEMSLKEASVSSGQSITALKVATHRAVKRLRVLLAGSDGDER